MANFRFTVLTKKVDENTYYNVSIAGKTIKQGTIIPGSMLKNIRLVDEDSKVNENLNYTFHGRLSERSNRTYIILREVETGKRYLVDKFKQYTYEEIKELLDRIETVWNLSRKETNRLMNYLSDRESAENDE